MGRRHCDVAAFQRRSASTPTCHTPAAVCAPGRTAGGGAVNAAIRRVPWEEQRAVDGEWLRGEVFRRHGKGRYFTWLYATGKGRTETLRHVGMTADGRIVNPHGYPDELVRQSIAAALKSIAQRRSRSAKAAAETRRRRQAFKVQETARRIVAGAKLGPRPTCCICGRGIDDPQSVARGIGSECWQDVLQAIEQQQAAKLAGALP